MEISVTDKKWVDNKVKQFKETAAFADDMDIASASDETIRSVITDLTRIVYDYCSDLENTSTVQAEN